MGILKLRGLGGTENLNEALDKNGSKKTNIPLVDLGPVSQKAPETFQACKAIFS